ncbi:hypothetical protein INP83_11760 [Mucilaginibacter sp. 21P]|uniref:hypothetical protein n=1 Tax=Mucilaginibacter sp. 21P TaxID=2778902 RepID=UPI001C5801E5|nr:hypothetical protein [Mucilaginibacter sp. 21P]QXV63781.1 hypothetical protein INP83_11760 [Mucilaginibacter sp. 21P]
MKLLLGLLVMIHGYYLPFQVNDLPAIRKLAFASTADKEQAARFAALMSSVNSGDAPVLYCYKGASVIIQAKYAFNPFVKYERFKSGKALIEHAFERDSTDLEIRLIRYLIQRNLPGFLGYHSDLNKDKLFIQKHLGDCPDNELKRLILSYPSLSGAKTGEQKQSIR